MSTINLTKDSIDSGRVYPGANSIARRATLSIATHTSSGTKKLPAFWAGSWGINPPFRGMRLPHQNATRTPRLPPISD